MIVDIFFLSFLYSNGNSVDLEDNIVISHYYHSCNTFSDMQIWIFAKICEFRKYAKWVMLDTFQVC